MPKLRGEIGWTETDLLSRNYVLYMCPSGYQSGSNWGWKSSKITEVWRKKILFVTNLEQMLPHTATYLNTKLTMMKLGLSRGLKSVRFLPWDCCCLNDTCN